MRRLVLGLVAASVLPNIAVAAPPSSIKATYEMYRNNLLFARIEETFVIENGKYRIQSRANPYGLWVLFSKARISRLSTGSVTAEGLRPDFYEEKRTSGDQERIRSAKFDWGNHKIMLRFDGKTETANLEKGTQDSSSFSYQLLFRAPARDSVRATVTDGKRVRVYVYHLADESKLTTAAGDFEAGRYVHSDHSGDKGVRTTEIWLAREKSFFPVKLVRRERGNVLEQRLVALNFD